MAIAETAVPGLLVHAFGAVNDEHLLSVFRSAQNAEIAMPDKTIEVVIQGPAVSLLAQGSPLARTVGKVLERGVVVAGCGNSMKSAGMEQASLLPGVVSVPAAVAHLARRQWDGWAYVRL